MRSLDEKDLLPDPRAQFAAWFETAAVELGMELAQAMCLSTVDAQGSPDARMVLLKEFNDRGFVFYTNTQSAKGAELESCAKAALTFFWGTLERQVRIQGTTTLVSEAEADAYFRLRPRGSQVSAWASHQSSVLKDRQTLDARVAEMTRKFENKEIPRPPYWTGYRLDPSRFEFWQGRQNRLHDRFQFTKSPDGSWDIARLYP